MTNGLIEFYVHGRGRGHGTRSRVLSDLLRSEGFRVKIFAGSGAMTAFEGVQELRSVDSLLPTMKLEAVSLMRNRLAQAADELKRERPCCIVSDGDLPGILHARRNGIPSVAVGHGLIFSHAKAPEGISRLLWYREGLKSRLSAVGSDFQLAVNFIELEATQPETQVVRPRFATPLQRRNAEGSRRVVCYFRDDNGDAILRALVHIGMTPVVFSKATISTPGVEARQPGRTEFRQALEEAHAVVSSAGSQLISECLLSNIPQFVLYKNQDAEQRLNAEMLRASGCGQGVSFEEFQPADLERFLMGLPDERQVGRAWGEDVGTALLKLVRRLA